MNTCCSGFKGVSQRLRETSVQFSMEFWRGDRGSNATRCKADRSKDGKLCFVLSLVSAQDSVIS